VTEPCCKRRVARSNDQLISSIFDSFISFRQVFFLRLRYQFETTGIRLRKYESKI